jgi:anti-sigma factor RsiW
LKVENIKEYIESGILELYVLGQLSPDEKLQVEEMAAKHTAVKAEIEDIERSMEVFAEEHAVEPSEDLRGKIPKHTPAPKKFLKTTNGKQIM